MRHEAVVSLSMVFTATAGCAAESPRLEIGVPPGSRGVTTLPSVASLPIYDLVATYHPRTQGGPFVAGHADLDCLAGIDQRVTNCQVLSEFPEGQGFGAAAQALSRWVLIAPGAVDGVPTEGRIRFRLSFPAPD